MPASPADIEKSAVPQVSTGNAPETLKDASVASISKAFNSLKKQAAVQREALRPALAKISEIVSKFQAAGLDSIGFEIASFDQMRRHSLMHQGKNTDATYGILSMYNARFLVRVYPDSKIDCFSENINKPNGVQFPDLDAFWFLQEKTASGVKINREEPKFMPYDLKDPEDVLGFTSAIVQICAKLAAQEELRAFDVPAKPRETLPKARLPKP